LLTFPADKFLSKCLPLDGANDARPLVGVCGGNGSDGIVFVAFLGVDGTVNGDCFRGNTFPSLVNDIAIFVNGSDEDRFTPPSPPPSTLFFLPLKGDNNEAFAGGGGKFCFFFGLLGDINTGLDVARETPREFGVGLLWLTGVAGTPRFLSLFVEGDDGSCDGSIGAFRLDCDGLSTVGSTSLLCDDVEDDLLVLTLTTFDLTVGDGVEAIVGGGNGGVIDPDRLRLIGFLGNESDVDLLLALLLALLLVPDAAEVIDDGFFFFFLMTFVLEF
jgi:hypothetical protein